MDELKPTFDFTGFKNGITEDVNSILSENQNQIDKIENRFPIEVFPEQIQEIIHSTNEHLGFPVDFIAGAMLFAAAVCIGNTHKVQVKKGWIEGAVIYLAIVARAGTNKSHPLSFALQPIIEHDKISYQEYEKDKREYDKVSSMTKKEREQQGIDEPTKPTWRKYLLSDSTPEALAEVHKFNKRGIGVYVDELAGWFKNFNRYNKGSEQEFWLSAYSGTPIIIDRKTGDSVYIPHPSISIAGTIQNGILSELAKDSRNQNGFIDRILFVFPANVQKQYWSESEVSSETIQAWRTILNNLMSLTVANDESGNPNPNVLQFSPDAKQLLYRWQRKNTDECNSADDELNSILSKHEIYVVRLALILQLLQYGCNGKPVLTIESEAVNGAIRLIGYFKTTAQKVHSILTNANPLEKYPADRQELYSQLPEKFTSEEGLQIAVRLKVKERTYRRFLTSELFKKTKWGEYEKTV